MTNITFDGFELPENICEGSRRCVNVLALRYFHVNGTLNLLIHRIRRLRLTIIRSDLSTHYAQHVLYL